jgi:hypothetical protein
MPTDFKHADHPEEGVWSHLATYLKKNHASFVGSIIYMSTTCRPDLAYIKKTSAPRDAGASKLATAAECTSGGHPAHVNARK